MKPSDKNNTLSKPLTNFLLLSGLGLALLKHREFLNFVKKLTLGINVQKIDNNTATFFLSSLNSLGVPYEIKSIRFFNEDLVIGGILTSEDVNRKIVKNSRIPITISLTNPVTKEVLETSKIAICFVTNFGIKATRYYNLIPGPINIENIITLDVTDLDNNFSQNTNSTKPHCGCNH